MVPLGSRKVALRELDEFILRVNLRPIEVCLEIVELVGIGLVREDGRAVEVGERGLDGVGKTEAP